MDPLMVPDPAEFPRSCRVAGPAGTRALGAALAGVARAGDALLLFGELGAGKTCLVQGLCAALGVTENVTSPTFTLINRYPGSLTVDHLDFYRIRPGDDLGDIGLFEVLDELAEGRTLLVAEWPARLVPLLARRIELLAVAGPGPTDRRWFARGMPALPPAWAALFPEATAPC
ncbi:MAG TPA: tRNA (adenosine(37)-N6)-threonylcarbamoyltransferase complex ATPase subunit type 1 TsaE [Candidatus Krumholzibacteria bacterium]|nr:tRNA (adenosine(37)-N6)-threonylcarbamoyltransferase complex ATPase subunit type 1 TsaE [Candidatus Krumholzibacteria bacterium]HPD72165.1 tRNA (adenosine(37)-N6)-threonylcarbamoyltransferase complex ATPase subunit type 1 TsaE [Candidatus Krumholzibacteria bacterium]HRY40903.1 tRNA (adenosine(37)-N6)-threonylcarbamoyltransferase complex ATPase subunit type 1 TsaE [Candidatus Krumholzibacteria bacterium]